MPQTFGIAFLQRSCLQHGCCSHKKILGQQLDAGPSENWVLTWPCGPSVFPKAYGLITDFDGNIMNHGYPNLNRFSQICINLPCRNQLAETAHHTKPRSRSQFFCGSSGRSLRSEAEPEPSLGHFPQPLKLQTTGFLPVFFTSPIHYDANGASSHPGRCQKH